MRFALLPETVNAGVETEEKRSLGPSGNRDRKDGGGRFGGGDISEGDRRDTDELGVVYQIPFRCAPRLACRVRRASKGILHTMRGGDRRDKH